MLVAVAISAAPAARQHVRWMAFGGADHGCWPAANSTAGPASGR